MLNRFGLVAHWAAFSVALFILVAGASLAFGNGHDRYGAAAVMGASAVYALLANLAGSAIRYIIRGRFWFWPWQRQEPPDAEL